MLCIWQLISLNSLVPELMFPSLKMIMANKVDTSASSSYYALLITVLVFVIVGTCCAEERSVYLVLMEEEPVAFHGSHLSHEGRKVLALDRYYYCCFPVLNILQICPRLLGQGRGCRFLGLNSFSSIGADQDIYFCMDSEVSKAHAKHLVDSHDQLLQSNLETGSYNKLYSFKHIVNGFSVHTTPSQVSFLVS